MKHEYFVDKKGLLVGKPKDAEIAKTAILHLIRKSVIKDSDTLTHLLELPFFNRNVHDPQIFFESLKVDNPSVLVIDPAQLDNAEYIQQIQEELKEKVITENQSVFQEEKEKVKQEIEKMKKELATIPTRLEAQEYEEPKIHEDEEQQKQEWWQTLNLIDDPFPSAEGLQKIDRKMYDEIIVKTEIFNKYVGYADTLRDQIFKNTIVYGEFGSGKTAFFDYLSEILLRNKILSVYVPLWAGLEDQMNIFSFEEELISRLHEECKRYGVVFGDENHTNHASVIRNMFIQLHEQKGFLGLVIFIDDLHKNAKAFDYVLNFLSWLQIFTSSLIKGNNLKVAVYVAGIPQWKTRISSEPRLSGSLIRDEFMPEVSERDAYNMLNRRMLTYSKNQDKKNIIGPIFVKTIYENLKKGGLVVTFRDFLRQAIDEFMKGNFDRVLTVNPRAISSEKLLEIRKTITNVPRLSIQFEQLLSRISNVQDENRQKCFEILGTTFLEGGINENSPQAERNFWALQQIERSGLINFISDSTGMKWVINKDLKEINRKIIDRDGVSMEDYLVPVFIGTPIIKKRRLKSPQLEILESILKHTNKPEEQQILRDTIQFYKPLLSIDTTHSIDILPNELVNNCLQSLSSLTRAFMLVEKFSPIEGIDMDVIYFWKTFWYKPSSLIEFINEIENKESADINRANYIFGLYKEAFSNTVTFLNSQIEKNRIFSISYQDLTKEDCEIMDKSRELWAAKEYYEMCSRIAEYVEIKLRQHVFNILTLIYGKKDNRVKRLDPQQIRQTVNDNMRKDEKKGLSAAENELQYLDRKHYKILMTRGDSPKSEVGHANWNEIFNHIFTPWNENDLLKFLDMFATYNTATAHNKNEVITNSQQHDLLQFAVNSMFFLQKLNSSYRKIMKHCVIIRDSKLFFSFKESIDMMNQDDVPASRDEFDRLVKRMSLMEEIEIYVDQQNLIRSFYNVDYRKFFMIVSLLLNVNPESIQKVGSKLVMLHDESPTFKLKLESVSKN